MEELYNVIFSKDKVVVITGAGISTLSGIPDFRGNQGFYTKGSNVEYYLSLECLREEPEVFYEFYKNNLIVENIEPNIVHKTLALLEERGLITGIITQNIDGLHTRAGSKNVIELHGNGDRYYCCTCKSNYKEQDYKESCICNNCGGLIRPDVVLYGESVRTNRYQDALKMVEECDKIVVLGSTLSVSTIQGIINKFIATKDNFSIDDIIIVNRGETDYDKVSTRFDVDLGEMFTKILKKSNLDK